LDGEDEWQRVQTPLRVDFGDIDYLVSLSGSAAFIGFPPVSVFANDGAGDVLVYKQNDFDEWERVNDPFVHTANPNHKWFGSDIDIDGDLACVVDDQNAYIYHQDHDSKWVQFETIDGRDCSISGDTIVVRSFDSESDQQYECLKLYNYIQEMNQLVSLQDPICIEHVAWWHIESIDFLSNDYLIFWKSHYNGGVVFIYYRDQSNHTFTLHQQLNSNRSLVELDNNILVVGGDNQTHIYELQNGSLMESITINKSFDNYHLSRQNLIATTNYANSAETEIYHFNIEDCTLVTVPTEAPSLPAICNQIQVAVADDFQNGTYWELYRVVEGSKERVKSHLFAAGDVEATSCLQEGNYEFAIWGSWGSSSSSEIPFFEDGDYTISTLYGVKIEGGKDAGSSCDTPKRCAFSESMYFTLPYMIAPSTEPSITIQSTLQPTQSPTVSSLPTEICYWIDIAVVFDDYPEETSWQLQKMNDSSDYDLLKTFNGTYDDATQLQKESMCLEGEQTYQFTIYDSYGDGMNAPGHYNVTSNGNLIVQGGEFGHGEITSFSIPFIPGSSIFTYVTQEPTTQATPSLASPPQTPFPTEQIEPTVSPRPQTPFPTEGVLLPSSASVVAVDDVINLTQGTTEAFVAVLENDSGSNLIVRAITSQPTNGQCSISFNLSEVVYFPNNVTFVGSDQCTYETCDDNENCDTAVVQINIGNNQVSTSSPTRSPSPPVASPDSASVLIGDDVLVSVLDNDTPTAGKTLKVNSILTQASNGSCSVSIDLQKVVYIPNPGFTGFDTCVYEACDSIPACDTATLTVIVVGK